MPSSELPALRVLKNESYKMFKNRVSNTFNLPEANFRLWVLVNRQNKTVRPDSPVEELEGVVCKSLFSPLSITELSVRMA